MMAPLIHEESLRTSRPLKQVSRLHSVLTSLKQIPRVKGNAKLLDRVATIEAMLKETGYAYPEETSRCFYEDSPEYIRAMTDELVVLLGKLTLASQRESMRELERFPLYNEEIHRE